MLISPRLLEIFSWPKMPAHVSSYFLGRHLAALEPKCTKELYVGSFSRARMRVFRAHVGAQPKHFQPKLGRSIGGFGLQLPIMLCITSDLESYEINITKNAA